MNDQQLNEQVRERTQGQRELTDVVASYLAAVRDAAGMLGLDFEGSRSGAESPSIEIELGGVPGVLVFWTPYRGWGYRDEHGEHFYRVGIESDAASLVPDAEVVSAWLRVLDSGDLEGHQDAPEALHPGDPALVERLATLGAGEDPHAPG
ncbi:hypothetical protein HUO13_18065 [Saccharopolyspora erythraea]|uniref:hypothetical protein n=1 Tax=Saccharopolyspora erythraea TaxID=1836 RepID=UPI001BA4ABEE|nr:hypothetical protein [Saccharopolyspora erythraea]QUH02454.1 hypothetical protein HUO13_18065 [Saccharopolyspora erythraea]